MQHESLSPPGFPFDGSHAEYIPAPEPLKLQRIVSAFAPAHVTQAAINYVGSVTLPTEWFRQGLVLNGQVVRTLNNSALGIDRDEDEDDETTPNTRTTDLENAWMTTYAIRSGDEHFNGICANGGAAQRIQPGDKIALYATASFPERFSTPRNAFFERFDVTGDEYLQKLHDTLTEWDNPQGRAELMSQFPEMSNALSHLKSAKTWDALTARFPEINEALPKLKSQTGLDELASQFPDIRTVLSKPKLSQDGLVWELTPESVQSRLKSRQVWEDLVSAILKPRGSEAEKALSAMKASQGWNQVVEVLLKHRDSKTPVCDLLSQEGNEELVALMKRISSCFYGEKSRIAPKDLERPLMKLFNHELGSTVVKLDGTPQNSIQQIDNPTPPAFQKAVQDAYVPMYAGKLHRIIPKEVPEGPLRGLAYRLDEECPEYVMLIDRKLAEKAGFEEGQCVDFLMVYKNFRESVRVLYCDEPGHMSLHGGKGRHPSAREILTSTVKPEIDAQRVDPDDPSRQADPNTTVVIGYKMLRYPDAVEYANQITANGFPHLVIFKNTGSKGPNETKEDSMHADQAPSAESWQARQAFTAQRDAVRWAAHSPAAWRTGR